MNIYDIEKDPNVSFQIMERYINKGSPSGFMHTTSEATSPVSSSKTFELPLFFIPDEYVEIGGEESSLPNSMIQRGEGFFYPIHPDFVDDFISSASFSVHKAGSINVIPTASARSVLCESDPNLCLKLHYPSILGRFNRKIPRNKWCSSLENSKELEFFISRKVHPDTFGMLPEKAGLLYLGKDGSYGDGGAIMVC